MSDFLHLGHVRSNDKRSLGHLPTASLVIPMSTVVCNGHGDAHENR